MSFTRPLLLLGPLLAMVGCDTPPGDDAHDHEHSVVAQTAVGTPAQVDDHGHDHDDSHGHDHGEADGQDDAHAHDVGHDDGEAHDHDDEAHDHDDEAHDHDDEAHDHDDEAHDHGDGHGHGDSWAVTAWGEHFEIFAEADPLVAGEVSKSHTHVTILRDFSPMDDGLVEIILRRDGIDTVFGEEVALRDGIFDVAMRPRSEGTYALFFRIEIAGRREEIPAGRVRVGTPQSPGGLEGDVPDPVGEVIPFLKEQQWNTRFATTWATEGELHLVARGPGRIRPVAGGEVVLSAPMNAVAVGEPWPHLGRVVSAGEQLFALTPYVASDRSLAELEALETEKRTARTLAEERLIRLESLLPVEAASRAEVDAARANVTSLEAQHEAARRDLRTARAGRTGGAARGERVSIVSPLTGQVADLRVRPGEVVTAGQVLGRVVRVEPYWIEVFLRPAQALDLGSGGVGIALRGAGMSEPVSIPSSEVRLVSRAPEVSQVNGTVACIFEMAGTPPVPLGSAVEAEVTLPATRSGIIVPASAIVDDAGTPVVFEQIDGEGFIRREVDIVSRQGNRLIVHGIEAGDRVVSVGGPVIRRATLVSSGVGHGHVH